eukprot:3430130-Prymnesium_polylepis.1
MARMIAQMIALACSRARMLTCGGARGRSQRRDCQAAVHGGGGPVARQVQARGHRAAARGEGNQLGQPMRATH